MKNYAARNFAVFLGKIAFRGILISQFRQNYEFRGVKNFAVQRKKYI